MTVSDHANRVADALLKHPELAVSVWIVLFAAFRRLPLRPWEEEGDGTGVFIRRTQQGIPVAGIRVEGLRVQGKLHPPVAAPDSAWVDYSGLEHAKRRLDDYLKTDGWALE